jgi:type I restriction enzyme S subunit
MSEQTHQKYPPSVQHGIPRLSPAQKGWKSVAIGKLVTEVVRPVEMGDDEIYTLVTAKRSRGGIVKREDLKGREIAVKNQFYIQAGDFIISKRQIVHGACGFVPKELDGAIVSNEYLALNFTDKVIPQFWEFLTHTIYFQQVCFHSSIGVHVEKMLFKVPRWYQWTVNIPTLKEQEKIASFLGAIDTRLTQLRRKHELLQTYKRGVMQKIFSQQIRFKGDRGKPFPNWNSGPFYDCLNEIVDFRGRTPVKLGMEWGGGNILSLSANNVKNGYIDFQAECNLASEELHEKWMSGIDVRKDDIIFTMEAPLGNATLIPDSQKYILSQRVVLFKTSKNINNRFLLQLIWSPFFQESLKSLSTGTTAKGINQKSLKKININYPTIEEQEKISDFLLAIDKKIEAISQQINLTEQFKKGLLQKMFV